MADFERILQDNFHLKKNLQTARHLNDRLEQQLKEIRVLYQEILDKHTAGNASYNQLQRKYQLLMAENGKDINTLTSQIEQLKLLIEQKQMELENFQIKIIPNLDQDMIRVKLITEMEGPYQEAIEKKDREINRLKQKNSQLERKSNIAEMQLQNKQKQFKRELEQTKRFYHAENQKIMKQLNYSLNKKQVKSYDKELFKSQRKELQELRYMIDLQSQNEADVKKQMMNLKVQKEKLLIQIGQLNQTKALQMHLSSNSNQIKSLKQQKLRIQDDFQRKCEELEKLQKKIKNIEKQSKITEDQLKKAMLRQKEQWQLQRQNIKQDSRKDKQECRRMKDIKERQEQELQILNQKVRNSQRELIGQRKQCQKMKSHIQDLQKSNRQLQMAKKQKLSLSKNIADEPLQRPKRQQYIDSQSTDKKQNQRYTKIIVHKEEDKKQNQRHTNIIVHKEEEKHKAERKEMQNQNYKLKCKLEQANKKIIELLNEKANYNKQTNKNNYDFTNSRDRAFSHVQLQTRKHHSDKPIMLQFRDRSFIPLIQPTVFTHQPQTKY